MFPLKRKQYHETQELARRTKRQRLFRRLKMIAETKMEGTRGRRKIKGCANVKRCKNLCEEKDKKRRTHVTV